MTVDPIIDNNLLQTAAEYGIIDPHKISAAVEDMKRKEVLSQYKINIWQGSDGMWYTHIYDNGKRYLRKRKTREELEDYLIDLYKEKEEEIYINDVFRMWSDDKLRYNEIQKGSYDRYCSDFKRFFPASASICRKKFKNITEDDLEEFIKTTIVNLNLSRKAYSGLATLINGIFKYGKRRKYTDISITHFMGDLEVSRKSFSVKVKDKAEETFSEDEIPLIRDYLNSNPDIWNLALMLQFQTGMRIGEISALKWEDISTDYDRIFVRRTEHKCKDADGKWIVVVKDFPKTEAGCRDIILPPQTADVLKKIEALSDGGEYLFMSNGKRIRENTFNKRLNDICEKLGITHHTTHKIRKTYGTMLLDGDVSDSFVAEQMGHKDVATTRKLYYFSNRRLETKKNQIKNAISF